MAITLQVNGTSHRLEVPAETPLLYVLRNDLGLSGPKFGCGLGQCGSCTVLIDGRARRSCLLPAGRVDGEVTTLEGLGTRNAPHPLQKAFLAEQALQCGYCTSGMIVSAAALLARAGSQAPSEAVIREALDGNLCRCGAHGRIVRAVQRAAQEMAASVSGREAVEEVPR